MRMEKVILYALCEFGWRNKLVTSGSQLNSKPNLLFAARGIPLAAGFPGKPFVRGGNTNHQSAPTRFPFL
jgi:hypothetical protein